MLLEMPPSRSSSGRTARVVAAARSIIAVGLVAMGLCRCGSAFSTASDSDAGDSSVLAVGSPFGDGGLGADDGSASGDASAIGCDPTRDSREQPCIVDGLYGVFVSATGHDTGIGTRNDPLKTIGEGIAKAALVSKPRVYVCNGSYAEQVSLDVQHDGISLYGGFDCARGWTSAGDGGAAEVVSPGALYALRVEGTIKPIAIEDMTFTTPDATGHDTTGAGNSSIAAFVSNESKGLTFRRVVLRGGAGATGSNGATPPTNWFSANAADLQGNDADAGAGGAAKDCPCKTVGDTQGGGGGAFGDPAGDGGSGTATPLPAPQGIRTGAGGMGFNDT
ncbi:MAG TPA: hypothetical protein VH137_02245, partial [Gemmatimonadales bacterium]|nr:hypothetical protein [Gemmatimonadales bacterium]